MSSTFLVIVFAVCAVALFVAGMSLTLIVKGHHIKSEIADNEEMRKRGITCAAAQMREEDAALRGSAVPKGDCAGCHGCTAECGDSD